VGHLVHHLLRLPEVVAVDGESSPVAKFLRRTRVRRPRKTNVTGSQMIASKARSGPPNLLGRWPVYPFSPIMNQSITAGSTP